MGDLKLYVKIGDEFKPVAAVVPSFEVVKKVQIRDAIDKYLLICTSQKCIKNQKIEKNFFEVFFNFLKQKGLSVISDVTYVDVLEFQNLLMEKMIPSSVNRRMGTIKNFFVMCERWEYVLKNVSKNVLKKRVESNPYKNWSVDEFNKLIKQSDGVWKDLLQFLWLTGARPCEAKGLMWTDIDYEKNKIILKSGKNQKISRVFPINDQLSKLLHNIKIDSVYVFSKNKKQIHNDSLSHYVRKRLARVGLKHLALQQNRGN